MYFILFFLQLLCIAPLTFNFFSAKNTKTHLLVKIAVYIFVIQMSFFWMDYTKIGNIYGGGRYLFGGSFFMIYVFGQIIYIYRYFFLSKKVSAAVLVISLLTFYILCTHYTRNFQHVISINPPGFLYFFYAISIFFAITFLFCFDNLSRFRTIILYPISFFGKYSFEIFLYHFAVINIMNNYIRYNNFVDGQFADANNESYNIFIKHAIVFSNSPVAHFVVGSVAFLSYLLIPSFVAILYRSIKNKYTSFSKGE